jgi:hypothetical protein
MFATTSHQPMRTRQIRTDEGRWVRVDRPSRRRQYEQALAEQTGSRR